MSIFDYDQLTEWEGFQEFNLATMRLRGANGNSHGLQALYDDIPGPLKVQAKLYLLEFSISSLSRNLLDFAQDQGSLELPQVAGSLEVAIRIRDALFTNQNFKESGHVELLTELAKHHGEAFAIDSMCAALDSDFADRKAGARDGAKSQERADAYTHNLELMKRFLDPVLLNSTAVGNLSFRLFATVSTNHAPRGDFSALLKLVSEYKANDLQAVFQLLKDNEKETPKFSKHIDAALRNDFSALLHRQETSVLYKALAARPMTALSQFVAMNESEMVSFISGHLAQIFVMGDWIDKSNLEPLEDQNFHDLMSLFADRLVNNPYFASAFYRSEALNKPSDPGIPFILMAQKLNERRLMANLSPGKYSTSRSSVEELGKRISEVSHLKLVADGASTALKMIDFELSRDLVRAYKKMFEDETLGQKLKAPMADDAPEGADKEYQKRFAAVRICAELHQPKQTTITGEKKFTPYSYYVGEIKGTLQSKNALLAQVKTYDDATVIEALTHYKAGFKPMIELGVITRKSLDKLPAKERGMFLEHELGM